MSFTKPSQLNELPGQEGQPLLIVSALPTCGDWWDLLALPLALSPVIVGMASSPSLVSRACILCLVVFVVLAARLVWPRLMGRRFQFYSKDRVVITNRWGADVARLTDASNAQLEVSGTESRAFLYWRSEGFVAPVSAQEGRALRALGYDTWSRREPKLPGRGRVPFAIFLTAMFVLGLAVHYGLYSQRRRRESERAALSAIAAQQHIEGKFIYQPKGSQPVEISVRSCLTGVSRDGRTEVSLALSSPLGTLVFGEERSSSMPIKLFFSDPTKSGLSMEEQHCRSIKGTTRVLKQVRILKKDVPFVEGDIALDCPALGIKGQAKFVGCVAIPRFEDKG